MGNILSSLPADIIRSVIRVADPLSFKSNMRLISPIWDSLVLDFLNGKKRLVIMDSVFCNGGMMQFSLQHRYQKDISDTRHITPDNIVHLFIPLKKFSKGRAKALDLGKKKFLFKRCWQIDELIADGLTTLMMVILSRHIKDIRVPRLHFRLQEFADKSNRDAFIRLLQLNSVQHATISVEGTVLEEKRAFIIESMKHLKTFEIEEICHCSTSLAVANFTNSQELCAQELREFGFDVTFTSVVDRIADRIAECRSVINVQANVAADR